MMPDPRLFFDEDLELGPLTEYSQFHYRLTERGEPTEEMRHMVASGLIGIAFRNPWVSGSVLLFHLGYHYLSRGGGGPSVQSQPPPISSSRSRSSTKSRQARAYAQGGKTGGPGRASHQGSWSRRESCPKGHYWSFKHKKCVKSRFKSR